MSMRLDRSSICKTPRLFSATSAGAAAAVCWLEPSSPLADLKSGCAGSVAGEDMADEVMRGERTRRESDRNQIAHQALFARILPRSAREILSCRAPWRALWVAR